MNEVSIQRVVLKDVEQLQHISRITFSQTFANSNSEEDMNKYLNDTYSIEQLNKELHNPETEFYFAIFENVVVGYLKVNFGKAQSESFDSEAFEIERIYVLQDFHGHKVGQLLFQKAVERAAKYEKSYIWLGVWEENHKAIHFYEKNGFIPFDQHVFKLGNDEQIDILMKLSLN